MADERAFNLYFANRGALPGEVLIEGDELLVLRGSTVYRAAGAPAFAYASMEANTDETTINTIDIWEEIAGTLIEGAKTDSFTFATNQYTYNGVNQAAPHVISAKMSILRIGNGDDNYDVGVFVNGVQIGMGMITSCGPGQAGFTLTEITHALQTGDIIDMRVRNVTSAVNCIVTNAQLVIG
jgi:hypothetical protein